MGTWPIPTMRPGAFILDLVSVAGWQILGRVRLSALEWTLCTPLVLDIKRWSRGAGTEGSSRWSSRWAPGPAIDDAPLLRDDVDCVVSFRRLRLPTAVRLS